MTSYQFRQFHIRENMMEAIQRYIVEKIPPGDFLVAVIDNDLREAVSRADDENLENLPAFIGYFYNEAPGACWGSPERRKAWLAERKLETVI